jgi:hypothetical protein
VTRPAAIIRRYKARAQGREYPTSRGCQRTREGWWNGRWIGRVSRDDSGFRLEVQPRNAAHSSERA